MVEYINSNDDAGNLALYTGIGVAAFAGGAALAYRATSPIYKKGDKGKDAAIADAITDTKINVPDSPSYARGASNTALGSMASLFGGNERSARGVAEMGESVRQSAMSDSFIEKMAGNPKAQDKLQHLGSLMNEYEDAYKTGLKGIGDDVKSVASIMGDGKDANSAYKEFKKNNPNSLTELDDVERHLVNQEKGGTTQERGVKKAQATGSGQSEGVPMDMLNDSEAANLASRKERLANMKNHERGEFEDRTASQQQNRDNRNAESARRQRTAANTPEVQRQRSMDTSQRARALLGDNPDMTRKELMKALGDNKDSKTASKVFERMNRGPVQNSTSASMPLATKELGSDAVERINQRTAAENAAYKQSIQNPSYKQKPGRESAKARGTRLTGNEEIRKAHQAEVVGHYQGQGKDLRKKVNKQGHQRVRPKSRFAKMSSLMRG